MTLRIAAVLLFASLAGRAPAQDAPPPPPPMDDAMLRFIAASSPNANHGKLSQYLGTWDASSSWWMDGPDQPPTTSRATSKMTWSFEGRFLRQEWKGYFLGMPMEGFGLNGYDNMKKVYTMLWVDNMGTAIHTATGTFDADEKMLTFEGMTDDPISGEMNKTVRYVLSKMVQDRFTFEFYEKRADGQWARTGEIVYTRAQEHR